MSTKTAAKRPLPSIPKNLRAQVQEPFDQARNIINSKQRAAFAWTLALIAFRGHGNSPASHAALTAALASNPHISAYLLGTKQLPQVISDRVDSGAENEAIYYVAENLEAWQTTTGALLWLAEGIDDPNSVLPN